VIPCDIERYFLPAFFNVMVHMLVHIVDDIVHLRPPFLHNMMAFQRMNGVIKGYVVTEPAQMEASPKAFLPKNAYLSAQII
jgi:hypothetical protein